MVGEGDGKRTGFFTSAEPALWFFVYLFCEKELKLTFPLSCYMHPNIILSVRVNKVTPRKSWGTNKMADNTIRHSDSYLTPHCTHLITSSNNKTMVCVGWVNFLGNSANGRAELSKFLLVWLEEEEWWAWRKLNSLLAIDTEKGTYKELSLEVHLQRS
jgi:hypothetical protein